MKKISLIETPYDLARYELWESQWVKPNTVGIHDYIDENCHPEDLLICTQLFLPSFITVDSCILLYDRYEKENFHQWKLKFPTENASVEKVLNRIYLYDLFGSIVDDVSDSIFRQLRNIMKLSWTMALKEAFPEKNFIVLLFDDDMGNGPSLTFYQKKLLR